jgi:uncharacterized protein (DUF2147 family)
MINIRAALAAFAVAALVTAPASAADPLGTYVRPSTGTQVEFYKCGQNLCGKIVSVKDASKKSTVGTVILKDAAPAGAGKWKGNLLNTEDGNTYAGHVSLAGDGKIKLEGCTMLVVCKGEVWQKVK